MAGKVVQKDEAPVITREQLDALYTERNKIVSLLLRLASRCGYYVGLYEDKEGEPGWKTVAAIDLPTGQVTWHLSDEHLSFFEGLPSYNFAYDGHSTEEKYERIVSYGR